MSAFEYPLSDGAILSGPVSSGWGKTDWSLRVGAPVLILGRAGQQVPKLVHQQPQGINGEDLLPRARRSWRELV